MTLLERSKKLAGPVAAQPHSVLVSLRALRARWGAPLRATRQFFAWLLPLILVQCTITAFALTNAEKQEIRDEAKDFQYSEVKSKSGLQYRIPEDMPIETRDGIEAPIPFDEYMYGKFKKMDERLNRIEATLARIEKTITLKSEEKSKILKTS